MIREKARKIGDPETIRTSDLQIRNLASQLTFIVNNQLIRRFYRPIDLKKTPHLTLCIIKSPIFTMGRIFRVFALSCVSLSLLSSCAEIPIRHDASYTLYSACQICKRESK